MVTLGAAGTPARTNFFNKNDLKGVTKPARSNLEKIIVWKPPQFVIMKVQITSSVSGKQAGANMKTLQRR